MTKVDPSEYEPQVVELPEKFDQETEENKEDATSKGIDDSNSNAPSRSDSVNSANDCPPVMDKSSKWLLKLQTMRKQFSSLPTDY